MAAESNPSAGVAAIVLAAGESRRMGSVKAMLPTPEGPSFLSVVVARCVWAGARPVVAVTGAHNLVVPPEALEVRNPAWPSGQLSSLRAGLDALDANPPAGVLVALVDHPLVLASTYSRLVRAFLDSGAAIVRPLYHGRRGHPIVLARAVLEELRATKLDQGARPVIARWVDRAIEVPVEDPGILEDLDTPEDLAKVGFPR